MSSTIAPLSLEQRAAHRAARYAVRTPRALPLQVYTHSTELLQLLRKRNCPHAALLTAHNPNGKRASAAKNAKAHAALGAQLESLGYAHLPGQREALDGGLAEEGYLVLGIGAGALEELMVQFEQEAALWCPASGDPVLMLHPQARRNFTAADIK
jgi:hypothetical protein